MVLSTSIGTNRILSALKVLGDILLIYVIKIQINPNFSGVSPFNTFRIGYYFGGDMELQIPGTSNFFVGTNSGTNNSSDGGGNTFIGWSSGANASSSDESTFIGSRAMVNI